MPHQALPREERNWSIDWLSCTHSTHSPLLPPPAVASLWPQKVMEYWYTGFEGEDGIQAMSHSLMPVTSEMGWQSRTKLSKELGHRGMAPITRRESASSLHR